MEIKEDWEEIGKYVGMAMLGGALAYGAYYLGKQLLDGSQGDLSTLSKEGQHWFHKAEGFLRESQYVEAEVYARQCWQQSPRNSDINNLLAVILSYQNNKIDEAIQFSLNANNYSPNDQAKVHYLDTLSNLYYLNGNWEEAISTGEQHLYLVQVYASPTIQASRWSLWRLASCYFNIENYTKALEQYKHALNQPEDGSPQHRLFREIANTNSRLERYNVAKEYYEYALSDLSRNRHLPKETVDAEMGGILNDIGVIHTHLDQTDEAIRYYMDSIERYHQDPFPYANIATIYAQRGNLEDMRKYLEYAVTYLNAHNRFHLELIDFIVNSKKYRLHPECFQSMISLFGRNHLISEERAKLLQNTNMAQQDFHISEQTKRELRQLIKKDHILEALNKLEKITQNKGRHGKLILNLRAQLALVRTDEQRGQLDPEQRTLRLAQIRTSLIEIIN